MPVRPAISDPGFELVRACAAAGFEIIADSRSLRRHRRAVDRRAADGSVLLRGISAGARRRAPRAPAVAGAEAAHAGFL